MRALPFVAWADVYFNGFKIGRSLQSTQLRSSVAAPADPLEAAGAGTRTVDIVLHEDVDASVDGVRDRVAAAAGVSPGDVRPSRGKVRMTVREEDLPALAALDEVKEIEEVPERVLYSSVAGTLMHARVSLNGTKFRARARSCASPTPASTRVRPPMCTLPSPAGSSA
ncbi:hypothetical protein AQI88_35470 [Streptomyces cellostaticus]|uniref:Uncharacterized protein n=1 Tax=Streptomyces cellostaticus TaxID=67285 RepID=A0A101NEJ3_9ACTN|nr:hypothetical protein [Streptomyces cellostaticus]KUM91719.1 hypothetical protein AQI88_35470 [Streptomyces cellostaticus]GHI04197.1 hypothetical protein Scel_25180 [Streptomyces cellostaticus]